MKQILIGMAFLSYTLLQAECTKMPAGMELAKSIEAKEISKAKGLLSKYKEDVKKYLAKCDQSKDTFEITSVMILTYEGRLKDIEHDMTKEKHTTDCSKVPSSRDLETAFKSKDVNKIKVAYGQYKKDSEAYLENCAAHPEYATVYDESLFYEEEYANW